MVKSKNMAPLVGAVFQPRLPYNLLGVLTNPMAICLRPVGAGRWGVVVSIYMSPPLGLVVGGYAFLDSKLEGERSQNNFLCSITFNLFGRVHKLFHNFQGGLFKGLRLHQASGLCRVGAYVVYWFSHKF